MTEERQCYYIVREDGSVSCYLKDNGNHLVLADTLDMQRLREQHAVRLMDMDRKLRIAKAEQTHRQIQAQGQKDREIAQLRAQVAELSVTVEQLQKRVAERDATIAELEAWKDAVPVDAINSLHYEADGSVLTKAENNAIREWLFAVMKQGE